MTRGDDASEYRDVLLYDGTAFSPLRDRLIREIPLEVFFNGRRVVTIACSGIHAEELALGFLLSEGLLRRKQDLAGCEVSPEGRQIRVRSVGADAPSAAGELRDRTVASSGALSYRPLAQDAPREEAMPPARMRVSPRQIETLMEQFLGQASLHKSTGGTHGTALAFGGEIVIVREDIGRHNAIDMIAGYAFLNDLDCREALILRTGRVSGEIVHKVRRIGVPLVASLSVPTILAVETAREAGITLIGSVRGGQMKIYSHEGRVGM
jgi:FdhD protein